MKYALLEGRNTEPVTVGGAAPRPVDDALRDQLLATLARLIEVGGWACLVRAPVGPGPRSFPDPWLPSVSGVAALARRLLWHGGVGDLTIEVVDQRQPQHFGARPRKPTTEVELVEVRADRARLALHALGTDDVAGTLAHEIGVAVATRALHGGEAPYRSSEPDVRVPDDDDRLAGSVAAVYLGLGVLATNAGFQQYSGGATIGTLGYAPVEYDIVRAGHLPGEAMAFLVAVQAELRGDDAGLAALLTTPAEAVTRWRDQLRGQGAALRARLGIPEPATWTSAPAPRDRPEPFTDAVVEADSNDAERFAAGRRVYRVRYNRRWPIAMLGLVGGVAGSIALGPVGIAIAAASMLVGHQLVKDSPVWRCSECIERLKPGAATCARCGGRFVGDLANRNDRLDAEEAYAESRRDDDDDDDDGTPRG